MTATAAPVRTPPAEEATVLAACPPDAQSQALRSGNRLDWQAFSIDACYELTLQVAADAPTYTGSARVTVTNDTATRLTELVFRVFPNAEIVYGGSLQIVTARVDGRAVTPAAFLADRTAVRLPLDEPLAPRQTAVVELDFRGETPVGFDSSDTYGIFTRSRTEAGPVVTLVNWFPLLAPWRDGAWYATPVVGEGDAVVSEIALMRATIEVPAGWHLVATGTTLEATTDEGRTRYTVVSGPVRDFVVVTSPAFEKRTSVHNGVRVVHWGLPSGEERVWDEALDVARESLRIFDSRFGPYQYAELDVAAIPMQNAAGVEYPGVALISASLYSGSEGRSFLPIATAHEVAHQWWYAVVGNDVLRAPWQDEALTTYSALLYFEEEQPTRYRRIVADYERAVTRFESNEGSEPITQPLSAFKGQGNAYAVVVYLKGALFFDALRDRLGDETFFQALQHYYELHAYTIAPPQALLDSFETACNCRLDSFYAEWGVTSK